MSNVLIYQTDDDRIEIEVSFEQDTVWLTQKQISELFATTRENITMHLKNVFDQGELFEDSVCKDFLRTASDGKNYRTKHYNLDAILSVGYRVNSKRGTQFRQWATHRLKEYLVQGIVINQKRLTERDMEVRYLKSGIRILNAAMKDQVQTMDEAKGLSELLEVFSNGLELLDDYDHENLDQKGRNSEVAVVVEYPEFQQIVSEMRTEFSSDIFGQEKDGGFESAVSQIYQSFDQEDLYPSIEEKAAMLLYFVVKNHAFVDGNKRIAAACFLYFLDQNRILYTLEGVPRLSGNALAALTLFVAASKPEDMEMVVRLLISVLNRGLG